MGHQLCFGTGILNRSPLVLMKFGVFWRNTILLEKKLRFCFVDWYFWHFGEMSEFRVVCDEPMLILLVCLQDRPGWS